MKDATNKNATNATNAGVRLLANAIILQAVKDYRNAARKLKRNPRNGQALAARTKAVSFLRSE